MIFTWSLMVVDVDEPTLALIADNVSWIPDTTESGSAALKYLPRPFTAVCQKSSMDLGEFHSVASVV